MRIFWLGAHRVLVRTELPRLRDLGYEVFNPPYLTSVWDKSAETSWDIEQPSTLPKEVFEKLKAYNFFYNQISPEIAEILNHYFDAVIVTNALQWLKEVLHVYHKKVIYRTYGFLIPYSELLLNNGLFESIVERDNFWFVPHYPNNNEHQWLRDREVVVPYTLENDVYQKQDQWCVENVTCKEIMLTCPDIRSGYYESKFKFIKKYFPEPFYRLYGVQLGPVKDPQVVGTLPRKEYLQSFLKMCGYLYTYTEPNICFLPPIEMMMIGGPVIFLSGSLLDEYFKSKEAPGRANHIDAARQKCQLLLSQDRGFIKDVIDSQAQVRTLYSPEYVWPIFDSALKKILEKKPSNQVAKVLFAVDTHASKDNIEKHVFLLHYFLKNTISFYKGEYFSNSKMLYLIQSMIHTLCEQTELEVVITCYESQVGHFHGFFSCSSFPNRVKFFAINNKNRVFGLLDKKMTISIPLCITGRISIASVLNAILCFGVCLIHRVSRLMKFKASARDVSQA